MCTSLWQMRPYKGGMPIKHHSNKAARKWTEIKKHSFKDRGSTKCQRENRKSAAVRAVTTTSGVKGYSESEAVNQLSKPNNRTTMIWVTPRVSGQQLKMKVSFDIGSAYSLIPLRRIQGNVPKNKNSSQ